MASLITLLLPPLALRPLSISPHLPLITMALPHILRLPSQHLRPPASSEPFPPGSSVFVRLTTPPHGDVAEGLINSVPTPAFDFYEVDLLGGSSCPASFGELISPDDPPSANKKYHAYRIKGIVR